MPSSITYRPDIDGLRALAVLAVVIFHLGFKQVEGGFLGVDIFFVISGFLITSILEKRIQNQKFTFKEFYFGRIRRLFPALLATVIFTTIAAMIIMTPADLSAYALSAIAAILSASNILFYFEAGYWDTASEIKPLLHTWSLGVEEQFYLIWPALLLIVFKLARKFATVIFFGITILGVFASQYFVTHDPSAAFFMFPLRIFEFSLGAFCVYISRLKFISLVFEHHVYGSVIFLLSLIATVTYFFIYDGTTPFPGYNAVGPLLATCGLLLSGKTITAKLLFANPLARWLGNVSYSMYLVHWPVVALYRYKYGLELGLMDQAILTVLTLFFTVLLYYLVEARFRMSPSLVERGPLNPTGFAFAIVALSYLMTLGAGYLLTSDGLKWRVQGETLRYADLTLDTVNRERNYARAQICNNQTGFFCGKIDPSRKNILVIGDSKVPDTINSLQTAFPKNNYLVSQLGGCPPLIDPRRHTTSPDKCAKYNKDLFKALSELDPTAFDAVVYSMRVSAGRAQDIKATFELTKKLGFNKVYVFGPTMTYSRDVHQTLMSSTDLSSATIAIEKTRKTQTENWSQILTDTAEMSGVKVINQLAFFCGSGPCDITLDDGELIMFDQTHLTTAAANAFGRYLAKTEPNLFD